MNRSESHFEPGDKQGYIFTPGECCTILVQAKNVDDEMY